MTLKIQKSADREFVTFTLSGRIEVRLTAELQKLIDIELGNRNIVLDMKEVQIVDRDTVSP
jgi:anti-anti-sigma regulatory factor